MQLLVASLLILLLLGKPSIGGNGNLLTPGVLRGGRVRARGVKPGPEGDHFHHKNLEGCTGLLLDR